MTEKYNAGEHVKIVKSDTLYKDELGDQTGLVGTVKEGRNNGVYVTFPHTADGQFYYTNEEVEPVGKKATPAPEPLFRKGDHVRFLAGHNEVWTGTEFTVREDYFAYSTGNPWASRNVKVTITKPSTPLRSYTAGANMQIGAHKLEKFTPAPFKVGDWVKVNYAGDWQGIVGQVKQTSSKSSSYTMVDHPTQEGRTGIFTDSELTLTEEPHWTETKPVGAIAQVRNGNNDAILDRVLVKVSDEEWLHMYQNPDGAVGATINRPLSTTKSLLSGRKLEWLNL